VKISSKSNIPYYGKHIRTNILGAICPYTGEISTLIFDYCDINSFQIFLNQLAEQTRKRSKKKDIILILDNASWHKSQKLVWQHIKPLRIESSEFYVLQIPYTPSRSSSQPTAAGQVSLGAWIPQTISRYHRGGIFLRIS
jgi:hypothetical protein